MNSINMANMPMTGGPVGVGGPMAMMGNHTLATGQVQRPPENNRANLNTYIYDYFLRERMFDCARAMLNSDQALNVHKTRDVNGNTIGNGINDDPMDTDSKDDIDSKRPNDLPAPNVPNASDSCFLYEWFCLFWDMLSAQRNKAGVSPQVNQYVNHTQNQIRIRQHQNQEMLRRMGPEMYNPVMQRMPMNVKQHPVGGGLARAAMANSQNNPHPMVQAAKQNQMQRDGSNMDGNQNRPASPGAADNAPSPSKRARLEGSGPFNAQHAGMMNGQRPQQGMPGQPVGDTKAAIIAQQISMPGGFPHANLIPQQFRGDFQAQPAQANQKIQTYSQGLQQHHSQQIPNKQIANPGGPQGQGSPMMPQDPNNTAALGSFYPEMGQGIRTGVPGGPAQGGGSNHALQDYQMQLMLLEQQNKKRLLMARQEQDNMGGIPRDGAGPGGPVGPGGPPGPNGQPFPDTSPQGVRPGASPNPNEQQIKRGTPQMNPVGISSPLPEGAQSRGSPNPMSFMPNGMDPNMQQTFFKGLNGMDPNMVAAQMNGNMRPPNHPGQPFNGQMNPQQMMARAQGGPQQMQWQNPNGNGMVPQAPQGPQGQVQGTPQQRAMPPPSAPSTTTNGNGRNTSSPQTTSAAPPTPQPSTKSAPKKKDGKGAKNKSAAQKNKAPPAGATPVPDANQDAEPPTPATPITPNNPASFKAGQNATNVPTAANVPASVSQAAPAPIAVQQVAQLEFDINTNNNMYTNIPEFSEQGSDILPDFDFDAFLHDGDEANGAFDFNSASLGFEAAPGEIGAE